MSIEAMKQALEAYCKTLHPLWNTRISRTEAEGFFEAGFKAAIAEAEKQEQGEPVAWISHNAGLYHFKPDESLDPMPLYITPQQRIWVGLTDEEMRELEKQFEAERVRTSDEEYLVIYPAAYWQWQRAIEDKLREKNT